jgi:hypothetical protein
MGLVKAQGVGIHFRMAFVVCVLSAVFSSSSLYASDNPWKLRIDKEGIKVFTRHVEHSVNLEFRASVTIDADLERVIRVFEDISLTKRWFYQCISAEIVEDEGPRDKVLRLELHLPWPVSERDSIFRMTKSGDVASGEISYALVSLPDRLPPRPGMVRVPYLRALWGFKGLPEGRTEVMFTQHSDPGGFVPAFISNALINDIPFNNLKNFRALFASD